MFKNIVTVTDGSDRCIHAVGFAAELAAELGSKLTILVASELEQALVATQSFFMKTDHDRMKRAVSRSDQDHIDQGRGIALAKGVLEDNLNAVRCDQADQATAILRKSDELRADLIVIGSRGRHGLSAIMLGSLTSEVIAGTQIPVLVVK